MNQITINFETCTPAPINGYNVIWRIKGSSDIFQDAGNFTSSPAIFTDGVNPDDTAYEGFIRADCTESGDSGSVYGPSVAWEVGEEPTECEGTCGTFRVTCVGTPTGTHIFWWYDCNNDYHEQALTTNGQTLDFCACDTDPSSDLPQENTYGNTAGAGVDIQIVRLGSCA